MRVDIIEEAEEGLLSCLPRSGSRHGDFPELMMDV